MFIVGETYKLKNTNNVTFKICGIDQGVAWGWMSSCSRRVEMDLANLEKKDGQGT